MLVKVGIAAAALIGATIGLISLDFREIYNEMYPVNGLRRDVLGLCREALPAFVRAIRRDRETCYDSMPHSVELAIGWVRTSSRLAATQKTPAAVELAERLMAEATRPRPFRLDEARSSDGDPAVQAGVLQAALARRCADPTPNPASVDVLADLRLESLPGLPASLSNERLAQRIAEGGEAALLSAGLAPQDARPDGAGGENLPILPVGDAAPAGVAAGAAASLVAALPMADLAEGSGWPLAPRASPAGCRVPA